MRSAVRVIAAIGWTVRWVSSSESIIANTVVTETAISMIKDILRDISLICESG